MKSSSALAKSPWVLAALLFLVCAADPPDGHAQQTPKDFPDGQAIPEPGPSTNNNGNQVTLWQLPDEYKAILETKSGELYGIYYSAWSSPGVGNPGVSDTKWVTGAGDANVPWAGEGNADLARELSDLYFKEKGSFMAPCGLNTEGTNTTCVERNSDNEQIDNLYLYGYWNGGGFAYWTGDQTAQVRPYDKDGKSNKSQINYYWNGDLFTTPRTDNNLRIQAFAGCKLNDQEAISSGKSIATSALAPAEDCEQGVAPVFEGGTLYAVEDALDLDEDFVVQYGQSSESNQSGGTIDNSNQNLTLRGRFDSVGDGSSGTLRFTGAGSTTIRNQLDLRGDLVVEEGALTIVSPTSLFQKDLSNQNGQSIGQPLLVPTPLGFEDGDNNVTVNAGARLRVAGDDWQDGVGPRTPDTLDEPISGDGNRRSPVMSLGDGNDTLTIEEGGLFVASYVGMLPSDYDLYKNNCTEGSDPSTCYRAVPQVDFGAGNDQLKNDGVVVGPGESPTGNYLELVLGSGNDSFINHGYLGCLTSGADSGGWNGNVGQNTCEDAAVLVGGGLSQSNDLKHNYNVNLLFQGGDDQFFNYGYLRGHVNMGGRNDELISEGGIRGGIVMGAGNDTLTIMQTNTWNGSGIVDDYIALGSARKSDSGSESDLNRLNLRGQTEIAFRNSVGFNSTNCGDKEIRQGQGGYGCRWSEDGGYNYLAISGSNGQDQIVISAGEMLSAGQLSTTKIWGSVELGGFTDSLVLEPNTHLDLVGDLSMGSGESQAITISQDADFSVRSIHGDVDLTIDGISSLGGDQVLSLYTPDPGSELGQRNTLSSYTGTTTVNDNGILRAAQPWSLSYRSPHHVDGNLIIGDGNLREDQQIAELTGKGSVYLGNQSHLFYGFYGGSNLDFEYSGSSSGNGSLVKQGPGTVLISGALGHTGFTKVHEGTMLLAADEVLSRTSTVLVSSPTKNPALDLGGTTQDVTQTNLHGGILKNGFLTPGNSIAVERRTNLINSVKADPTQDENNIDVVVTYSAAPNDPDVKLTFAGSNEFQNLSIDRASVEIAPVSSLALVDGIQGSDFSPRDSDLSLQDRVDVRGQLTVGLGVEDESGTINYGNGLIDLGAGNDLFKIGFSGSVSLDGAGTDSRSLLIQGGAGAFDVFWNENADLDLDASNIDGFEIVAYRGEGLAYIGEKTSAIVTANDFQVPEGSEYGLIGSTASNSSLIFGSDQNSRRSDLTQIGLLRIDGESTDLRVLSGSLEIAALDSTSASSTDHTITLGFPLADQASVSSVNLDAVASGGLSVGSTDGSIASMRQLGGIWTYEGDFSSAALTAQGAVIIGTAGDSGDSASSASFKSINADGTRRLLVGTRADGHLTITQGLHDVWSDSDQSANSAQKASLLAKGDVVLGSSGGSNPSTYSGLTVVMEDGSITTLEDDAISPHSPTLVRGLLSLGETSNSGVQQNFARRLIIGKTGAINNGNLVVTSLANAGDVSIDSLTIHNGMTRILDRLAERDAFSESRLASLTKIKAQGSLKNLGGSIAIAGDLTYSDNADSDSGHALINANAVVRDTAGVGNPPSLQANRILMGAQNDLIFNSGTITTTTDDQTSIHLGGGNDLILNRGMFNIGSSIIDGGEPLEISGSIRNRESRSIQGLNIFRGNGVESPGIDPSQLVNFAAIKLTADGDWIFPQGHDCRVSGVGRTFSEDKSDCVGIVGVSGSDQYLRITNGATVETGFVELGRASENSIEVLDGTLDARLIDGVVGDFRLRESGELVFDQDLNASLNSLIVGSEISKGSVKAEAIHNIASIHLLNGFLDADLIHAADLDRPELIIGSPLSLNGVSDASDSNALVDQLQGRVFSGSINLGESVGYEKAIQLGGVWGYGGDFSDIDLTAQGVVTTPAPVAADQDDGSETVPVTFKSISASAGGRLLVGAREDGELTIQEGLYQASGSQPAAIINRGLMTLGQADVAGTGSSTYTGATVLMKGSTLTTLSQDAISPQSPTLVSGLLQIGDASSGSVQQDFARRLLVSQTGAIQNGDLSVTSFTNAGTVEIDSLRVNNGMTRLLDRLNAQQAIDSGSRLFDLKAQGSLKNLGGSLSIAGDLIYEDDPDATAGHALINVRHPLKPGNSTSLPSITAGRITMGSGNDVILNAGTISTTINQDDQASINLGGGNDLILSRGTFNVGSSYIDGGEPLVLNAPLIDGKERNVQGFNVFRQGRDPNRPGQNQSSGLDQSQLVNFAAIKLDPDGEWIFPQGNNCQLSEDTKIFDKDERCIGIIGKNGSRSLNQTLLISNGARVDAGVVALGRALTNKIVVRDGSLRAVLIEAVNNPGSIILGKAEGDSSGQLIVGGISGSYTAGGEQIAPILQLGGDWTYAISASSDDFGVFPAVQATGTMRVGNELNRPAASNSVDDQSITTDRATFDRIEGVGELKVENYGTLEVLDGIHGDSTDLITKAPLLGGSSEVRLSGESTYGGSTFVGARSRLIAENENALSPSSPLQIQVGGVVDLQGFDQRLSALTGAGEILLNPRVSVTQNPSADDEIQGADLTIESGVFSGSILDGGFSGLGSVTKDGVGRLLLSGSNDYAAPTNVMGGVLAIARPSALSPNSPFTITAQGRLDLSSVARAGLSSVSPLSGQGYTLSSLTIQDRGSLSVSSLAPLTVQGDLALESGTIAAYLDTGENSQAPIQIEEQGSFVYGSGDNAVDDANANLYMVVETDNQFSGETTWNVIDGNVKNTEQLAKNTFLLVPAESSSSSTAPVIEINGRNYRIAQFAGHEQPLSEASLTNVVLKKGSLKLVVDPKSADELNADLSGDDPLSGCESNDALCDVISDVEDEPDQASQDEEQVANDIIEIILDEIDDEAVDNDEIRDDDDQNLTIPLVFDYGQLARLVGSGLTPRNVDAPGRGLFNYNNLLVDTVFERLPIRQFRPVAVAAVVEQSEIVEPASETPAEPIRGLWSKTSELDDQQAQRYLDQQIAAGEEELVETTRVEVDGVGYEENPSLTAELADREGVRAWFRGFGGDSGPTATTTLANDYSATAGGSVLGVDLSITPSFQVGVFANYGDVYVNQYSGDTGGGGWSSDGWGGGIRADWWTDNFYVQGLFAVSGFEGSQSRNILRITDDIGAETARGDRSATSFATALRLGAPFQAGAVLLEPQLTAAWTRNQENGFTESGAGNMNLRYGDRTTNFLQTELGLKLSLPINSGDTGQWVPNLRVAWLGDWDQNNEDQTIGYSFTDQTVGVASEEANDNGVLIEAGLDYTMARINSGSWKLFVRGGAEVWGGVRGTDWRASGGVTWQF